MKKILTSLALLSIFTVTACNTSNDVQPLQQNGAYSSLSSTKANANWFDTLSPDVQDYYASAKGLVGQELFDELHKIISKGTKITGYSDSKSFMYATADNTQVGGKPGVIDAYSGIFAPGSGGNGNSYLEKGDENKDGKSGDFINCEHTWPQSFFNKALPMVADLHHLQSTMSVPNNRRSHFPFGMATGNVVYTTSGGSKLSVGSRATKSAAEINSLLNASEEQSASALGNNADPIFEPMDTQKGNTSRALLYFVLRYYDQSIRSGEYNKQNFWVSKVPTFIKWDEQVDPVNDVDKKRNDVIFKKQGNRNPFVDIPNLATIIGENVLESK